MGGGWRVLYFWLLNIFKEPFSTFQMEGKRSKRQRGPTNCIGTVRENVEVEFSSCEWKRCHPRAHNFLLFSFRLFSFSFSMLFIHLVVVCLLFFCFTACKYECTIVHASLIDISFSFYLPNSDGRKSRRKTDSRLPHSSIHPPSSIIIIIPTIIIIIIDRARYVPRK